jgi:hypothetical protein
MAREGIHYCEACKARGIHTHVRPGQAICRKCMAELRETEGASQAPWPGIRPNTRLPGCTYWPLHASCLAFAVLGLWSILWDAYSAATRTPLKYWLSTAGSQKQSGPYLAKAPWSTGPSAPPGGWIWWATLMTGLTLVFLAAVLVVGYRRWDRAEPWRDDPLA